MDAALIGFIQVALIVLWLTSLGYPADEERPALCRTLRWTIVPVLTAWLWLPWVGYGVQVAWRKNTAAIAYIERTPIVEPANDPHIKAEK